MVYEKMSTRRWEFVETILWLDIWAKLFFGQNYGTALQTNFLLPPPQQIKRSQWPHKSSGRYKLAANKIWIFEFIFLDTIAPKAPSPVVLHIRSAWAVAIFTHTHAPARVYHMPNAHTGVYDTHTWFLRSKYPPPSSMPQNTRFHALKYQQLPLQVSGFTALPSMGSFLPP